MDQAPLSGTALDWDEDRPWPSSVDGASLLDELIATIRRFVVVPPESEGFQPGSRLPASEKLVAAVTGGPERQDSVRLGLAALPPETRWVAART